MNKNKFLGICRMFAGICLLIASALSLFVSIRYGWLVLVGQFDGLQELVGTKLAVFLFLLSLLFFPLVWPVLPFIGWYVHGAFPWEFVLDSVMFISTGAMSYALWRIGKPLYMKGFRMAVSPDSPILTFVTIIRTVLWTDLFTTRRRASRLEFWVGGLGILGISHLNVPLEHFALFLEIKTILGIWIVRLLYFCIFLWVTASVYTLGVRRFHDRGLLGWPVGLFVIVSYLSSFIVANLDNFPSLSLLSELSIFAAIVLFVVILIVGVLPSRLEKNQWGLPAKNSVLRHP